VWGNINGIKDKGGKDKRIKIRQQLIAALLSMGSYLNCAQNDVSSCFSFVSLADWG
jgi:hypothetical protein